MIPMRRVISIVVLAVALTACGSVRVSKYSAEQPKFTLEEYFIGTHKGYGLFFDRSGAVRRRFTVDINGTFADGVLKLDEVLVFTDGETVRRTYTITRTGDDQYEAEADGLVGKALIENAGNASRWSYRLRQRVGDSEWTLTFDDWMYLQEDGVVLNRATVTKWGFRVGEVFMSLHKLP